MVSDKVAREPAVPATGKEPDASNASHSKPVRMQTQPQPQLLIVDDNPTMIQVMARMLQRQGQLRFATTGAQALQLMQLNPPDLVLLDAEMPGMSGYEVCEAMKAYPELKDVPVIFVTGHSDAEAELRGLTAGAVDFIAKPVHEALLLARVRTQLRIKSLTDELRRMATTDALTGVFNRRHFDESLQREWQRARRTGCPLSLLMVDVDHFKRYNDTYGHPAGDACLKSVGLVLQEVARRSIDVVARLGGEEFAILLPDTDLQGAFDVGAAAVQKMRELVIPHAASLTASHVTVSAGVATSAQGTHDDEGTDGLMARADAALYAAKSSGRDRCMAERLAP